MIGALNNALSISSGPAARMTQLQGELAAVNRQIADLQSRAAGPAPAEPSYLEEDPRAVMERERRRLYGGAGRAPAPGGTALRGAPSAADELAALQARAADLQRQIDDAREAARGMALGTGDLRPTVEPPPEKTAGGGGRGRAPAAERDDTERLALERLSAEEKVDDAILDRRTRLIEASYDAGKISLDQEFALPVENLDKKWALEEDYFAKKKAAATGDVAELQKLDKQELIAHQAYLSKRQDLDVKYYQAKKAQAEKAAADQQAALDKALQPIESGFDTAIKGWIQGTTTLQQGLQRAFDSILLDPLIKNLENGLKTALSSAVGDSFATSTIGKFLPAPCLAAPPGQARRRRVRRRQPRPAPSALRLALPPVRSPLSARRSPRRRRNWRDSALPQRAVRPLLRPPLVPPAPAASSAGC